MLCASHSHTGHPHILSQSHWERSKGCIEEVHAEIGTIIEGLQQRGFKSPYLRTYVVARINPVRFHRSKKGETKPAMPIASALTRMLAAARKFDADSVKRGDLALVAAVASEDE